MSSIVRRCGLNSLPIKLWIQTVYPWPVELWGSVMTSMREVIDKPHSLLLNVGKPYWNIFLPIFHYLCLFVFLSKYGKKVNFTFFLFSKKTPILKLLFMVVETDKLERNHLFFPDIFFICFIKHKNEWMHRHIIFHILHIQQVVHLARCCISPLDS